MFNQNEASDSDQQSLKEKTTKFANWLEQWREIARRNQLATLIWQIYQDTAYLDYVGGMPAGKQRQANLFALVDRAYQLRTNKLPRVISICSFY